MSNFTNRAIQNHSCPVCWVSAGENCRTKSGRRLDFRQFHRTRGKLVPIPSPQVTTSACYTVDDFVRMNPETEISHEQILYCRYLESRGKRFCIDFGYENAEQMAWDDLGYVEPDFEWEVLNV